MSLLWKIKKWFLPNTVNESGILKKTLSRHEAYKFGYRKWLDSQKKNDLLNRLQNAFLLRQLGVSGDVPVLFSENEKGSIFLIHYIDFIGKDHFFHLFDYLKDRTNRLGYTTYIADVQQVERDGFTERVERYVLKPSVPIFSVSEKSHQLYGNVLFYHQLIDGRPICIRIQVEYNSTSTHFKPKPFAQLIENLLN